MQLVFRANNILEAHIVAGLLKSHEIECHVGGHFLQGAVGDLPATDFAHIFVEQDNFEAAQAIIDGYENNLL